MSKFDDIISEIANAMSIGMFEQTVEKEEYLINELKEVKKRVSADFLSFLDISADKFGNIVQAVYEIAPCHNDAIVRFIANGIYKEFHESRIKKIEGFSCCADKASFVTEMTLKALKDQTNISLFDDYRNAEQIEKDKERQAYWSPTSIKDTDEAIKIFLDWYGLKNYSEVQSKALTGLELAQLYAGIQKMQEQNKKSSQLIKTFIQLTQDSETTTFNHEQAIKRINDLLKEWES
ncbi:hypothetical protein ABC382_00685 [Lysinibacillus sp. 1P01SD]|uniref:hypothetical protein n=1 Tax=Lysinibacillus sp. 1P01SD TaxID=3132285 RepID=UPI0039A00152